MTKLSTFKKLLGQNNINISGCRAAALQIVVSRLWRDFEIKFSIFLLEKIFNIALEFKEKCFAGHYRPKHNFGDKSKKGQRKALLKKFRIG